jgi:hypothetical protein
MIHQADEAINITYDKKKPGTKLLECYVTIYTGMFAVVPVKQMGREPAGNFQRILMRATPANRKITNESRHDTARTELLSFSDKLPIQSRPEVRAQSVDRHGLCILTSKK